MDFGSSFRRLTDENHFIDTFCWRFRFSCGGASGLVLKGTLTYIAAKVWFWKFENDDNTCNLLNEYFRGCGRSMLQNSLSALAAACWKCALLAIGDNIWKAVQKLFHETVDIMYVRSYSIQIDFPRRLHFFKMSWYIHTIQTTQQSSRALQCWKVCSWLNLPSWNYQ